MSARVFYRAREYISPLRIRSRVVIVVIEPRLYPDVVVMVVMGTAAVVVGVVC